jgi:hypothetical protein
MFLLERSRKVKQDKISYGELENSEMINVFEYFDFPLFFISRTPDNDLYLNYYIKEVSDDVDKWFFSRISTKEHLELLQQRISVLDLLMNLKNKNRLNYLIIDSTVENPDAEINLIKVDDTNLEPLSFPENDFFVEYDHLTDEELYRVEEDVIDSSRFKLILKDDNNSHDIGLNVFLKVLDHLKKSINGIAHDIGSKVMDQLPTHEINLRLDSLQPSSFGVWLKTEPNEVDLFEVPEKSLNNLFEIIDDIHKKDIKDIKEQIEIDEEYSLETIKSIKNLLKDVVDNKFALSLEANTKSHVEKSVEFGKESYDKLDMLTQILKEKSKTFTEEVEVEGLLTSINTTYNRFRISTDTIGEIGGKMSSDMFKKLKDEKSLQFRVPSIIKATITKETVNDYLEGEHNTKFILTHFEQPDD